MIEREQPGRKLRGFYSYSHRDERLRNRLGNHLAPLRRRGLLQDWHDRIIQPGRNWKEAIDQHLESADIILTLISPDFVASDYGYGIEMQRALERQMLGQAIVVPIILVPVDWDGLPFSHLQALPRDGRPVTTWRNRELAFLDIAKGIRRLIEEFPLNPS